MNSVNPVVAERRRFNQGRPLTTAEVEQLILEDLDFLEQAAETLATVAVAAARAEVNYRVAHARAYLDCEYRTGQMREQYAVLTAKDLLRTRRELEAQQIGAAERCRMLREEISALRTIAASARAAEHGS